MPLTRKGRPPGGTGGGGARRERKREVGELAPVFVAPASVESEEGGEGGAEGGGEGMDVAEGGKQPGGEGGVPETEKKRRRRRSKAEMQAAAAAGEFPPKRLKELLERYAASEEGERREGGDEGGAGGSEGEGGGAEGTVGRGGGGRGRRGRGRGGGRGERMRSGFIGVSLNGSRWSARISVAGKKISLGGFETEKEAALAYDQASRAQFGDTARCNVRKGGRWGGGIKREEGREGGKKGVGRVEEMKRGGEVAGRRGFPCALDERLWPCLSSWYPRCPHCIHLDLGGSTHVVPVLPSFLLPPLLPAPSVRPLGHGAHGLAGEGQRLGEQGWRTGGRAGEEEVQDRERARKRGGLGQLYIEPPVWWALGRSVWNRLAWGQQRRRRGRVERQRRKSRGGGGRGGRGGRGRGAAGGGGRGGNGGRREWLWRRKFQEPIRRWRSRSG
jgi:hypothetical protein